METKTCGLCGEDKAATTENFHRRQDKLVAWCKPCRKSWDAKYYERNKDKIRQQKKAYHKRTRKKLTQDILIAFVEVVENVLGPYKCVDCGEDNPMVLEFDHLTSADKAFNVSDKKHYVVHQTEALIEELQKCEIRCANCHRIRTHKQFNTVKYRLYQHLTTQK